MINSLLLRRSQALLVYLEDSDKVKFVIINGELNYAVPIPEAVLLSHAELLRNTYSTSDLERLVVQAGEKVIPMLQLHGSSIRRVTEYLRMVSKSNERWVLTLSTKAAGLLLCDRTAVRKQGNAIVTTKERRNLRQ